MTWFGRMLLSCVIMVAALTLAGFLSLARGEERSVADIAAEIERRTDRALSREEDDLRLEILRRAVVTPDPLDPRRFTLRPGVGVLWPDDNRYWLLPR